MADKKLHIILDIDETLLHHVKPRSVWDELSKDIKSKYRTADAGTDAIFILRPYLKEFLSFLFKNKRIDVSIWTWSDAEYAMNVANMLTDDKPELFANIWSSDHAELAGDLHGKGKDLNFLWYGSAAEGIDGIPGFMPCNTILVDDLDDNVNHPSNNKNSIQVPAFAPSQVPYNGSNVDDSAFLNVIDVIKSVLASPDFCRDGDLPHPFESLKKVPRNRIVVGGKRNKVTGGKRNKVTGVKRNKVTGVKRNRRKTLRSKTRKNISTF